MNCKPNQRAIVTRTAGNPLAAGYLGMVFTVRSISRISPRAGPVWSVDPDNRHPTNSRAWKKGDPVLFVADCLLTPLPDDPDAPEQQVTDKEIEHA